MNTGKNFLSLWALPLILFSSVSASSVKIIQLTDTDKAQIIQSVLLKADLLNRRLSAGEKKEVVYFSTENISSELIPKIQGVKFILLSPDKIAKKSRNGVVYYYSFGEFKITGSGIIVTFNHSWQDSSRRLREFQIYEYQKISNKWVGKEIVE